MLDRRSVLKILGGGVVGTLLTPAPWKLLYDAAYWTQNWSWIPRLKYGENAYVPTVSKLCPSGVGMLVRTVNGRPVRTLGNPDNILSQGGITALAATQSQLACAPSRVTEPLKRTADGAYLPISWEEAMQVLTDKVKAAEGNVAGVTSDYTGSIKDLFSAFLSKLGSADFYLMPSEEQNAQKAWENMGGKGRFGYNVKDADFIFSVGANYLENWGPVVYNRKDYDSKRPTNGESKLSLAYAGPSQTNTAACSDFYLPCKANFEYALLLGIAHLLIRNGAKSYFTGFSEFATLTADMTPETVEKMTGVPAAKLIQAVEALKKAKKPLVIVGNENGNIGVIPMMAGIACNLLLADTYNSEAGQLVGLPFSKAAFDESASYSDLLKRDFVAYTQAVADGSKPAPKVLMIHEANPVYSLPMSAKVGELIEKAECVVSFSTFMDETSSKANLVLPLTMDFERFDDVETPYGSGFINYSAGQPAVPAPYEARAAADIVLALAKNVGKDFPIANAAELIATKADKIGADMDSLLEGETFISEKTTNMSVYHFNMELLSKGTIEPNKALSVAIQSVRGFGTPTTGIPPFSTKLITNDQLVGKYMVAQMNSATASELKLKAGQRVKLSNEFGEVVALVSVYEGVQNNTVLLPLGLGHTAFDAFSQNKGENVMNLTGVAREAVTNALVFAPMYVSAQRV